MEDYNRSHRYRDDNRSSSNERNYGNNWDRTYNRSDDWGGYNTENRDTQYSDKERGYSSGGNQMNRNYYNDKSSNRGSYNTSDNNRNYMNDYNRWNNYNNDYMNQNRYNNDDYNRNNFRGDYTNYRNDYMRSNDYDRDNNWNNDNRYKNEGWNDRYNNYREQDRNWWDRTKDEVASWFGDDDAQRRRDRDERYDDKHNGEHRGKGPKNYTRSQERIKEDVSDKLSDDSFLDASDIDVEVNGNEVTLSGHVDSRYSKHRAEDLAEDVTGVSHVQNNLRVWDNTSHTTNSNSMNTNTQNTNMNTNSNTNTPTGSTSNKNKKDHVTL